MSRNIAFSDSNIDWNTTMPFLYSSIVSQNGKINTQNRVKAIHCNRVVNCLCWNHRHFTQRLTQQDQTPSQCPMFILAPPPHPLCEQCVLRSHKTRFIQTATNKRVDTKMIKHSPLTTYARMHRALK